LGANPRRTLTLGLVAVVLGTVIAFFNMLEWDRLQFSILNGASAKEAEVLSFYGAQAISTAIVLLGLYEIYRFIRSRKGEETSLISVMGDAVETKHALEIGGVVAILYAILYTFFSALVVYQPTVNFAQVYGVSSPGWTYVLCCGDAGTVPKLVIYLSPSLHIGMNLVPLTLLFVFLVPALVGFNAVVSYYALRRASAPLTGRWLAASGAAVGLFTACPTCAGLFLASSIGGIGTTLAVTLAPYQLLFVAVSLPVLLLSPVVTAFSVKRSYEASCRLPPVVPSKTLAPP
jgi:hypothetical protein